LRNTEKRCQRAERDRRDAETQHAVQAAQHAEREAVDGVVDAVGLAADEGAVKKLHPHGEDEEGNRNLDVIHGTPTDV